MICTIVLCLDFVHGQDKTVPVPPQAAPVSLAPYVLHAKLKHGAAPEYPAAAVQNHIAGLASVKVLVDETGKVQQVLENCDGCSSVLQDASIKAVEKWEYQPTLLDGKPVSVTSTILFRFSLDKEPSVEVLSKLKDPLPMPPSRKLSEGSIIHADGPAPRMAPNKLRISSGVAESNLVHKIDPEYPQAARIAHIQGDVVLQCIIDREGDISDIRVVSGHPVLIQPSLDAVKQWKYKPYTLNGQPVEVETTIIVHFRM